MDAFEKAAGQAFYGTDESMLLERIGVPVAVVEGEPGNIKVTHKEDLETQHD
jgi:2-C-methyl-D-erythritol 4-phosphate cytidylyltransferase